MKIAFDLDGVLDKPALAELCRTLVRNGVEVHIITGVFDEAGDWQSAEAKRAKLHRLGVPFRDAELPIFDGGCYSLQLLAVLHVLHAVSESYPRDYRLADLGLRKGEMCERLGISMIFDDSPTYCEIIPRMAGNTTVLQVR